MGLNGCVILIGSIIYCLVWLLRNCGKVEKEAVVLLLNIYFYRNLGKREYFNQFVLIKLLNLLT